LLKRLTVFFVVVVVTLTSINTVSAPQPTGACCLPDESCIDVTADTCEREGGSYQGDGTECSQLVCEAPPTTIPEFPGGATSAIPVLVAVGGYLAIRRFMRKE
jgi:hypothetical protein